MMMRLMLLLGLLVALNTINAQTISSLEFPYVEGLQLNYEGSSKRYDMGDSVKIEEYTFGYEVFDVHDGDSRNDIVRFKNFNRDGTILSTTYLYINEKGMVWWVEADDLADTRTQAIKLPLKNGKKWGCKLYEHKAKSRCIGVNLDIETEVGTFKGFGVETVYYYENYGYKYKSVYREYYNQKLGKIRTESESYIYLTKKEATLWYEDTMSLVSYKLPDGTKSN